MRLFLLSLCISILGVVALSACNSAEFKDARTSPIGGQSVPTPADGVRRVTVAELKALVDANSAFVIDVRNKEAYEAGHIRGSKLIPEGEITRHLSELPGNKLIVTYCSWPNEHTSARAVVELKEKGITNAAALLGGFQGWQAAGLPVDGSPAPAASVKVAPATK